MSAMKTKKNAPAAGEAKAAEDVARARRKRAAIRVNQSWRTACGAMEDTPEARAAWDLGAQWRRTQTEP